MKELKLVFPDILVGDTFLLPVLYKSHLNALKNKNPIALAEKMKFHYVHVITQDKNYLQFLVSNTFKRECSQSHQKIEYNQDEIEDLIREQKWDKITENTAYSKEESKIFYWDNVQSGDEKTRIFTIKLNWRIHYEIFPGINLFFLNKENSFSKLLYKNEEIKKIINSYELDSEFVKIDQKIFASLVALNLLRKNYNERKNYNKIKKEHNYEGH